MKWSSSLSALLASSAALVSASPAAPRELKLFNLKVVAPLAAGINGRFLSINPDGSVGISSDRLAGSGPIPPGAPVPPSSSSAVVAEASAKPKPGAKFYVTQSGPTGTPAASFYELHTYPIGIVDHALGLNGSASDGLRYLVDVTNPGHNTGTGGSSNGNSSAADYKSFTLENYGSEFTGNGDGDGDDGHAEIDIAIGLSLGKRIPPALPLNGFKYGSKGNGRWILIQNGANSYVAAWYDGVSMIVQNYRSADITYEPTSA